MSESLSPPPKGAHQFRRIAILFAGGPAPGANADENFDGEEGDDKRRWQQDRLHRKLHQTRRERALLCRDSCGDGDHDEWNHEGTRPHERRELAQIVANRSGAERSSERSAEAEPALRRLRLGRLRCRRWEGLLQRLSALGALRLLACRLPTSSPSGGAGLCVSMLRHLSSLKLSSTSANVRHSLYRHPTCHLRHSAVPTEFHRDAKKRSGYVANVMMA
mgnify:CR=1 FL=1